MTVTEKIFEALKAEIRFLFFQEIKPNTEQLKNYYLTIGIVSAWVAGIGRYWDNPRADLWQHLGLGSVAYVFLLALILWALIKPLRPENWSYKSVLVFVGMTAPPGILYAIPVERYFTLSTAQSINVWFLAIVATWRVILLFQYLIRSAKLSGFTVFVSAMMPLVIIISVLAILNLEHVVFKIMAGSTEDEKTANDSAYVILLIITYFSFFLSPILLISYLGLIWKRRKKTSIYGDDSLNKSS